MSAPQPITAWRWFHLPKTERWRRIAELKAAIEDVQDNRDAEYLAGIDMETDRDRKLADRVHELSAAVPWWRRP